MRSCASENPDDPEDGCPCSPRCTHYRVPTGMAASEEWLSVPAIYNDSVDGRATARPSPAWRAVSGWPGRDGRRASTVARYVDAPAVDNSRDDSARSGHETV